MEGKEEVRGAGQGERGAQPGVGFGCSAALSEVLFPHPPFDRDAVSPTNVFGSQHLTHGAESEWVPHHT